MECCQALCSPALPSDIFRLRVDNTVLQRRVIHASFRPFASAMASAANEQQVLIISKGQSISFPVYIDTLYIGCIFKCQHIGAMLIHLRK